MREQCNTFLFHKTHNSSFYICPSSSPSLSTLSPCLQPCTFTFTFTFTFTAFLFTMLASTLLLFAAAARAIQITSPANGTVWSSGEAQTIAWDVSPLPLQALIPVRQHRPLRVRPRHPDPAALQHAGDCHRRHLGRLVLVDSPRVARRHRLPHQLPQQGQRHPRPVGLL